MDSNLSSGDALDISGDNSMQNLITNCCTKGVYFCSDFFTVIFLDFVVQYVFQLSSEVLSRTHRIKIVNNAVLIIVNLFCQLSWTAGRTNAGYS